MSVGIKVGRQDLDSRLGQLALITMEYARRVEDWVRWAGNTPQTTLEAPIDPNDVTAGYGYTTDEAFAILATVQRLGTGLTWIKGGALPTEIHDTLSDLAKWQGTGTG
jgi:hypothetical protein